MPETVGPKRFYMSLRRATHTHSMAHTLTTKSDPEIDINT